MVPHMPYISDYGGTSDLVMHQLRRSWEICMHMKKEGCAGYFGMSIQKWMMDRDQHAEVPYIDFVAIEKDVRTRRPSYRLWHCTL
jgi:hypothetical protein